MPKWIYSDNYRLRILETAEEMEMVEDLQRQVWVGSETEIVPVHLLVTVAHNGGIVVGAFAPTGASPQEEFAADQLPETPLIGFTFGFPGSYFTPDGPRLKHCSHMLGVHPDYRDSGVGFALKRAQWQMVRHQGIDLITWTYDPLLSRNARLNIARLGAVCSTLRRNEYGEMRDETNAGLPSDRFQVDWWVNSSRVFQRLSRKPRLELDLAHFLAAGAQIINPTHVGEDGWPEPPEADTQTLLPAPGREAEDDSLLLVEIPADFTRLKAARPKLALPWRLHTRSLFEALFSRGYLVTDFIYLRGSAPRSFYVLSHGESTL